jgi:hypothetical protein
VGSNTKPNRTCKESANQNQRERKETGGGHHDDGF